MTVVDNKLIYMSDKYIVAYIYLKSQKLCSVRKSRI